MSIQLHVRIPQLRSLRPQPPVRQSKKIVSGKLYKDVIALRHRRPKMDGEPISAAYTVMQEE
jgi:hypothetical protein